MTVQEFELDLIQANPYQTRKSEDPQHIKNLALSIAAQGLLQIPSARVNEGKAQLVFGHSRLAAFKFLRDTGNAGFESMPLNVVEMSDEQMFQAAVAENRERKDLTPIEEAEAMRVYRDQFKKKSAEIGELFHLSDSAVRNKLRLLDLPEGIQQIVGISLTEGAAREVLAAFDLPVAVREEKFWWDSGSGSFNRTLEAHLFEEIRKGTSQEKLNNLVDCAVRESTRSMSDKPWKHTDELVGEGIEGLCKGCQFLITREGKDFCAQPACFESKTNAWRRQYLSQASLLTGIAILEDDKYGYGETTDFDYGSKPVLLEKVRQSQCENLRLKYSPASTWRENEPNHLKKEGFSNAEIVCCKRGGHCTCLKVAEQGVTVEGGSEEDRKEARRVMKEQQRLEEEIKTGMRGQAELFIFTALGRQDLTTWKKVVKMFVWRVPEFESMEQVYEFFAAELVKKVDYGDKKALLNNLNNLLRSCELAELDISFDEPKVEGKTLVEVFEEEINDDCTA